MAKEKAKHLAEDLWTKFKDSLGDKEDKPLKPPSKPPVSAGLGFPVGQNPLPKFESLSLSDSAAPGEPLWSNSHFVGGFHPVISSRPSSSVSSLPRPPQYMPTPVTGYPQQQSLIMQMALQPPPVLPLRPHSNPIPFSSPKSQTSASRPPAPAKPASLPATPVRKTRSDSSSTSSSSSSGVKKPGQEQCSGVTKAGKRCTRMVKTRQEIIFIDPDSPIPRFCFQHSKELMTPSGYYSRKNGQWVKFEDWIPAYLQAETQVSLRVEMEKARSQSDVPGYIYTFEIRETREGDTIKLKVGRAVNLVKRIDQWGKQCGSKEQVLRGFYPGSVEPDEASLMKGRVIAGEKGPWCHRLERLIHLELADLVSSCIYLEPSWPNIDVKASSSEGKSKENNNNVSSQPCPDCGSMHKEIFEFKRWKRGKHRGKEWDDLVKPVVERWGKFVELYV